MEYGAERKISRHSILGATVSVGVPQGVSLKIKSVQDYTSRYQRLSITCVYSLSSTPAGRSQSQGGTGIMGTSLRQAAAALTSSTSGACGSSMCLLRLLG